MKTNEFLASELEALERRVRAIYISTYIPRKCGIATFTKDLTNAVNLLNPSNFAEIMAVTNVNDVEEFPWEVKMKIDQDNIKTYHHAASYINQSSAAIVNIQHEFGIYGGPDGEYILELTSRLKKPLVTTFHTVLSNPGTNQRRITNALADQSEAVVVMVESARERLITEFDVDPGKIVVVPHGVPDIPYGGEAHFKEILGFGNRPVMAAINLLSENKGVEYVLEALPALVKKYPDILYLVIGQTHPDVIRHEAETYRHSLEALVVKNHLEKNVQFINKYLSLDDLVTYLRATDIYITPYLDPQQTSSGTLAYALGAGKVCVSTPYLYAKEVLKRGQGVLVPFKNSATLGASIDDILADPKLMERYKQKAYQFGRMMIWPVVALQYLDLFSLVLSEKQKEPTGE